MYPLGFHPLDDFFLDDMMTFPPKICRLEAGVKYYFVNYGISSYFPPGSQRELVLGIAGRDKGVPELSEKVPYDPFKVDIFTIGNVLRGGFQAVSSHDLTHQHQLMPFPHFCVELYQPGILYALNRAHDANGSK